MEFWRSLAFRRLLLGRWAPVTRQDIPTNRRTRSDCAGRVPWLRSAGASWIAFVVVVSTGVWGCEEKKRDPDPPAPSQPPPLCAGGYSEDPARADLEPGIRAFRRREYENAQAIFEKLAEAYPKSATTLGWYADAILFDRGRDSQQAARDARPIQRRARKLHEGGCRMPRRPLYYLWMGEAYGALRLAKGGDGYVKEELQRARLVLEEAAQTYPNSAEISYQLARAHCGLSQVEGVAHSPRHVEACVEQFERALEKAASLERPRFLRTHRSVEDWIVRSETQSEFDPLRAHERYPIIVERARKAALEPPERPSERRVPKPR